MSDAGRLAQGFRKLTPGSKGGEFKGAQWIAHPSRGHAGPVANTTAPFTQLIFNYNGTDGTNGSPQNFIVPAGVTFVLVDSYGAEGGTGTDNQPNTPGGLGSHILARLEVIPGETLHVFVGGRGQNSGGGGYNGGGSAPAIFNAGGAGGASDVRRAPYGLADRMIIAAGGGGGGISPTDDAGGGGGGGFPNGIDGIDNTYWNDGGGGGGTQVAGGTGGFAGIGGTQPGDPGTLGMGGAGGVDVLWGGGGGGGGLYGGGGGGGATSRYSGGGGGSSAAPIGTMLTSTDSIQAGHGLIVFQVP